MGIPITGTFIRGADDTSQFAIVKADALVIPIQTVTDISGRDTLPEYLRMPYMLAYVISTGDTYRLGTDITIGGQVWTLETGNYILVTEKGAASGVAPLDSNSKIPNQYINQILLSQVHAVADITEMLALTAYEGNLVIVSDASDDPEIVSGSAVYVKLDDVPPVTTLANYLIVEFGASVTSVNGDTGIVSVGFASMIAETGSSAAFEAAVSANATVTANAAAIIANAVDITSLENTKSNIVDVLVLTNLTSYTPTLDYHPSTKKYVDDEIAGVIASPTPPGGNTTEVQFNSAGAFAGNSGFTFATSILTTPNLLISAVPDLDESADAVLVRAGDGSVKYRSGLNISASLYDSAETDGLLTTHTWGNIPIGTDVATLRDRSMTSIFDEALFATLDPTIGTPITLVQFTNPITAESLEVGTTISDIGTTFLYDEGEILNGDGSAGPVVSGWPIWWDFYEPDNNRVWHTFSTAHQRNSSYPDFNIVKGSNIWRCEIDYDIGTGLYYDNKGGASNVLDAERAADRIISSTPSKTGYYGFFYGFGAAPTNSAGVRAGTKVLLNSSDKGTFNFTLPDAQTTIWFATFGTPSYTVTQDPDGLPIDLTSLFTDDPFNVDDAGATPRAYQTSEGYYGAAGHGDLAIRVIIL